MMQLTIREVILTTNGILQRGDCEKTFTHISIDSRHVNEEMLFIPIIGERFDGHDFLKDAYEHGCRLFLSDENHVCDFFDATVVQVKNTTKAYDEIARYYREKFDFLCVEVTGSVGKTSTKDMIYSVLKEKYKTLKNEGNLNNEIGIPKTLFCLDDTYEAGVLEAGLSYSGDILELTNMIQPQIGVISNIGMSHIENFRNQDEIFQAKMEIAEHFQKGDLLIVNGDDPYLAKVCSQDVCYDVWTYGFQDGCDCCCKRYEIRDEKTFFEVELFGENYSFAIPSNAKHNIYNAMAAILVGVRANLTVCEIKRGLSHFELSKGRLTMIVKKDYRIIDDSYNASCDSMISALQVLTEYEEPLVAILGDILETGSYHEQLHRQVGEKIPSHLKWLITIGKDSKYIEEEAILHGLSKDACVHYEDVESFLKEEPFYLEPHVTILIKASHGIHLEKVVDFLNERED